MNQKVSIIGSGFSSLSASCYLAKSGYDVTIYEKNDTIGGRARQLKKDGFTFDIGPSWYWMPDILPIKSSFQMMSLPLQTRWIKFVKNLSALNQVVQHI